VGFDLSIVSQVGRVLVHVLLSPSVRSPFVGFISVTDKWFVGNFFCIKGVSLYYSPVTCSVSHVFALEMVKPPPTSMQTNYHIICCIYQICSQYCNFFALKELQVTLLEMLSLHFSSSSFVIHVTFPSFTVLVPLQFIIISLVFFYRNKLLFSDFLQFKGISFVFKITHD